MQTMKNASIATLVVVTIASLDAASAFSSSWQSTCCRHATIYSSARANSPRSDSKLFAGGWGNNQERGVMDEEFGGVNGSPIYDSYEVEDRGKFMQRVNEERKSLRLKKAADLLEVARIAGVELKKKERDPEK